MRFVLALTLSLTVPILAHSATIKIPRDYPTIQQGIDAATNGDVVLVNPGIYKESIDFKGKAIIVKSKDGPVFTIIDGQKSGSVVTFINGENLDSILDGFTVKNGTGTVEIDSYCGGGIYCKYSSPTIQYNTLTDNTADYGGGIYCVGSPIITNNIITDNSSDWGGGILCGGPSPIISNNKIIRNSSYMGGGISSTNNIPIIRNNIISENVIVGANGYGGGISFLDSFPKIMNNTITKNSVMGSKSDGVGIYFMWSIGTITNTILFNETSPSKFEIGVCHDMFYSDVSISYSDVRGGKAAVFVAPGCTLKWGQGMIDADPLFADPAKNDFHLTFNSPCKNTGINATALDPYDFEGDPRNHQGSMDMGADEFHTHLYYTGNASPGSNISLKFIDNPNTAPVVLWLGSGVLSNPMSLLPYGDWYLQFPILLQAQLGSIPGPDGVLSLPCTIPINLPSIDLPLQAGIGMKLSNLLELKIH